MPKRRRTDVVPQWHEQFGCAFSNAATAERVTFVFVASTIRIVDILYNGERSETFVPAQFKDHTSMSLNGDRSATFVPLTSNSTIDVQSLSGDRSVTSV